jgi:hypothetical protein
MTHIMNTRPAVGTAAFNHSMLTQEERAAELSSQITVARRNMLAAYAAGDAGHGDYLCGIVAGLLAKAGC